MKRIIVSLVSLFVFCLTSPLLSEQFSTDNEILPPRLQRPVLQSCDKSDVTNNKTQISNQRDVTIKFSCSEDINSENQSKSLIC